MVSQQLMEKQPQQHPSAFGADKSLQTLRIYPKMGGLITQLPKLVI